MDSETGFTIDSASPDPQPRRLKDLACSVRFRGGNDLIIEGSNLLHKLVLERSEPNKLGNADDIRAVLLAMRNVPSDVVNALNDFGYSALHLAVLKRNLFMVEKLLSCLTNIDVDARCECQVADDCVALIHAATRGDLSIVRELLRRGASTDLLDKTGMTALCRAAWWAHLDVMELLVSKGASVNPAGVWLTPLSCAVKSRNLAAVEFLVRKDADINGAGNTGQTPLHTAAEIGNLAMVHFLAGKRANTEAANQLGMTPLHCASESPEVAAFLLDQGADLHAADRGGRTPLHYAADGGSSECVAVLMNRGADIRVADADGWTPLHNAAREGRVDVVTMLLERGADASARTGEGKTALDLAEERSHQSCIGALQNVALRNVDLRNAALRNLTLRPRCCVM